MSNPTFFISLIDSCFNSFRNRYLKDRHPVEPIDLHELRSMIKGELYDYLSKNRTENISVICHDLTGAWLVK